MTKAEDAVDSAVDPTWESAQVRFGFLAVTAAIVSLLDQVSKYLIYTSIGPAGTYPGREIAIVPGVVHLNYVQNRGGAFGLLKQFGDLFIPIYLIIMAAVFLYYRSVRGPQLLVRGALSLQLGGAVGNLLDRLRFGSVIDFVDLQLWPLETWPVFNVADSAIVVGVIALVLILILRPDM